MRTLIVLMVAAASLASAETCQPLVTSGEFCGVVGKRTEMGFKRFCLDDGTCMKRKDFRKYLDTQSSTAGEPRKTQLKIVREMYFKGVPE